MFDLVSLIETSIVLFVYTCFLAHTYCQIGFKYLGIQEHCSMCAFFFTELMNLFIFTWVLLYRQHEIGQIVDAVLFTVINCILLYYSYQMRIVQFKLECVDHASYFTKLRRVRIAWIVLSLLAMIAMGLEITWNVLIEKNNHDTNKMPGYLLSISLACLSIQLVVYSVLIF